MGATCSKVNVLTCLGALDTVLKAQGAQHAAGSAVATAQAFYQRQA